jgi:hypothetical protein
VILALLAAVVLAAPASAADRVVVTRDGGRVPAPCGGVAGTARVVRDFLDAYSRGDGNGAVALWAPDKDGDRRPPVFNPAAFQWYSLGEGQAGRGVRRNFAAFTPAALRKQTERRARYDDTMRLTAIQLRANGDRVAFEPRIERAATDLRSVGITQPVVIGKGELRCKTRRLTVMSLAHGAPLPGELCPPAPAGAVAACTPR